MSRVFVCFLVLIATSTMVQARGSHPKIAILGVNLEGDAPPPLRGMVDKALATGLKANGYDVISRETVAKKLKSSPELIGCTSVTCLESISKLVGADRFVTARINGTGPQFFNIDLSLLGADADGGVVRAAPDVCNNCRLDELEEKIVKVTGDLFSTPLHVTVISEPSGAEVSVDGRELGVTPQKVELSVGNHVFRAILKSGYKAAEVSQSLSADGEVKITLEPNVAIVKAPPPVITNPPIDVVPQVQPRFAIWKWAAVGGSAAFLVTGITLIALDGKTADCAARSQCMSLYRTMASGITFTVAGVAVGGLAAYMFYSDSRHEHHPVAAIVPTPGGAAMFITGRF